MTILCIIVGWFLLGCYVGGQLVAWHIKSEFKKIRAPDDSFGLVDGLHRSLLGALGNSICPEVAYQILRAVRPLIR